MNPAHRALRERTAAAHDRVDTLFAGFDLGARAGYAAMLAAHAEALLPLEAALDGAAAEVVADWPERRREPLLRADLADLAGQGADAATQALRLPAPARSETPSAMPVEAAAGHLYVLEGSRHGGRFVARGLRPGFPRRYLDADQATGKWRELLSNLESILYSPQSVDRAVDAALEAFAAFESAGRKWLAKV